MSGLSPRSLTPISVEAGERRSRSVGSVGSVRSVRSVGWRLLLAAFALASGACAGLTGPGAESQAACWPRFPYAQGWLGGDAAYSVPLSATRSVWLFGDTFVGRPDQRDRAGAKLIHNSVALSECREGSFRIRYAWGEHADGSAAAFLQRPSANGFWWLMGGFLHEGRLYVGLLAVEPGKARGALSLPFRIVGSSLARIDNPEDDPSRWRVRVRPLARGPGAQPVSAFVVRPPYVYLFAFLDIESAGAAAGSRHPRILTRLRLEHLTASPDTTSERGERSAWTELGESAERGESAEKGALSERTDLLETWTGKNGWQPGLLPESAARLMDDDATEMSVRFDPVSARWLAVYNFPELRGAFPETRPSDAVWLRTAPALEGPWSARRLLFRIPELAGDLESEGEADGEAAGEADELPARDRHLGCYAAKEQPQFSRPGSLTFTYVCNLFAGEGEDPYAVLRRLQRDMDLYRPIAASVTLPWDLLPPAKSGRP